LGIFETYATIPNAPVQGTASFGALLLPNGKVLLATIPAAQIFDPKSKTFLAVPYPSTPVFVVSMTALADGRILLTGTQADGGGRTEIYDPLQNSFSAGPVLPIFDDVYSATLLPDGKVLFVGSAENDGYPENTNLFDPASGTVTVGPNSIKEHNNAPASLLPDGTVIVSGGQVPGGNGDTGVELYNPATGTFSVTGSMNVMRHGHTSTLLSDGTLLVAGGFAVWPSSESTTEFYHPSVLVKAPVIFSLDGSGAGQGAIWVSSTGLAASVASPAGTGQIVSMYVQGLAKASVIPPQVVVSGQIAPVLWFGDAPGYAGYSQVNFQVPSGLGVNSAATVQLGYMNRWSNTVTIAVH
jgi:hypothetical protein